MSRYSPLPLTGEPVPFKTAKQRRELIGARVQFTEKGWLTPRGGIVDGATGKNLSVDGNWYWVDSIERMTRLPA